jgi:hypothetical protein
VRLLRTREELAPDLRLRAYDWAVFFALEDGRTLGEMASRASFDTVALLAAVGRMEAAGFLEEQPQTMAEYLRAAGDAGDDRPIDVSEFLRASLPAAAPRPNLTEDLPSLHPEPAIDDRFEPLSIDSPDESGAWRLAEDWRVNPARERAEALSLRAVLDFLMARAADPESGQLDVYRTFLRIDSDLLRQNGITTLDFDDDRWIDDPPLVAAILASLERTAGATSREALVRRR